MVSKPEIIRETIGRLLDESWFYDYVKVPIFHAACVNQQAHELFRVLFNLLDQPTILRLLNIINEGHSVLSTAAFTCNVDVIRMILSKLPANNQHITYRSSTEHQENVLHIACIHNNYQVVDLIIETYNGPKNELLDITTLNNMTALQLSSGQNSMQTIRTLLYHYDGNVSDWLAHKDLDGHNALHIAIRYNTPEVVELILEGYKENKSNWINENKRSFDHNLLVQAIFYFDQIKKMDSLSEEISSEEMQNDSLKKVQLLLRYGADPNVTFRDMNSDQYFQLEVIASDYGNEVVAEYLRNNRIIL